MKRSVYLRVEGRGADLESFSESVAPWIVGSLRSRRHDGGPFHSVPMQYWRTTVQEAIERPPEAHLLDTLNSLQAALQASGLSFDVEIFAVVVMERESADDIEGIFFTRELIALMAKMNVALDIDYVTAI